MTTPLDLKRLLAAASAAPWDAPDDVPGAIAVPDDDFGKINLIAADVEGYFVTNHRPDAALIVALRNRGEALCELWEATERLYDSHGSGADFMLAHERLQRARDALRRFEA